MVKILMSEKREKSSVNEGKSKIGFGVIGCGWVARDYGVPAICAAHNARLVAACDTDEENLKTIASSNQKIVRTKNLEEFLRVPNLEAVYIATPNDSHGALTARAAAAGKHILCEKPMATNYADAAAMVEVCEAHNVQYATAFDQRFQARHIKLRELISAGALGTISMIKIHYACWLPGDWCADNWRIEKARAGGGAFIDLAPHGIDLAQILASDCITDFTCFFQNKIHDYKVDDGAAAIGKFSGGALFSLNVAYNCPDEFPRRTLEIIGSRRMARAVNTMGQTAGGELILINRDGTREEVFVKESEDVSPFRRQIETFADCLLSRKAFPFSPAQDLETMKIITGAMNNC